MFALLVELEAKADASETLETLLQAMLAASAGEPGTLLYCVHRVQQSHTRFALYELYRDEAAFAAHLQSAPIQQAMAQFDTLLQSPPRVTRCDQLWSTSAQPA